MVLKRVVMFEDKRLTDICRGDEFSGFENKKSLWERFVNFIRRYL